MSNHALSASVNHGRPEVAATPRPTEIGSRGNAKAMNAEPAERNSERVAARVTAESPVVHAKDLPEPAREPARGSGNLERDTANQRQQDELHAGQTKQRQELEQSQARDHERATQQTASRVDPRMLEQQHQAQTQELTQRHAAEQKTLRTTQQSKPEEKRDAPTH